MGDFQKMSKRTWRLDPSETWLSDELAQDPRKKVYGVFKGGGPKGAAFAGAIQEVEKADLRWAGVSGASAGAITAAFIAAGYSGSAYEKIMKQVDFIKLLDLFPLDRLKYEVKMYSLLKSPDKVTQILNEWTNFVDGLAPHRSGWKDSIEEYLSNQFNLLRDMKVPEFIKSIGHHDFNELKNAISGLFSESLGAKIPDAIRQVLSKDNPQVFQVKLRGKDTGWIESDFKFGECGKSVIYVDELPFPIMRGTRLIFGPIESPILDCEVANDIESGANEINIKKALDKD